LYALDEERLRQFQPDLILTQELCDVCAVSYTEVQRAVRLLDVGPRVVSLEPTTLDEVLGAIDRVGELTGRAAQAAAVLRKLHARLDAVRRRIPRNIPRPRVWVSEWLDPPYSAGHWVPDQVEVAGGEEVFHRQGNRSARVTSEQVVAAAPEVLVLAPCGFHLDAVEREMARVTTFPGWGDLPAVRANEVWAVDASSFFSRPGPRLVAWVELLAQILHPDLFGHPHSEAARRVLDRR
jgi:iron complex transport system substrate-binding protein